MHTPVSIRRMRTVEQERYEAIFRAIGRHVRWALYACLGATLLLSFAFVLVAGTVRSWLPPSTPDWLAYVVMIVPFFVVVGVVPNLVSLLILRGEPARAIEVLNAVALGEVEEWKAVTGRKPPRLLNRRQVRRWLRRNEGQGTRLRTRLQLWAGQLGEAAASINEMPVQQPSQAFHQALLADLLKFVATGSADLSAARADLRAIPPSPDLDHAKLSLAFEEARLAHAEGKPWLVVLADARGDVQRLPRGASIRDRLIASLPMNVAVFGIIGVSMWVLPRLF